MAEVRLKVVLDGAEQTISTVSQLEDALKRTKDELSTLDIGSKAFKDLQDQARKVDSEIKNIQKSTEGIDTAQLAGSFAKLGESVVGAFAISTSAAKLFGKESEDLVKAQAQAQETLNIVLGARAIAEGVVEGAAAARLIVDKVSVITTGALTAAFGRQTVALAAEAVAAGTATGAQVALNTAMKLSPIGLLIAAIGALIIYWDDLTEALGLSNSDLDDFNEQQKKVSDDLDKELNKALAETSNKYFELGNAIKESTGAAQTSWITTAAKDLPELINLTGKEADAVERTTAALTKRQDIADLEAERARNLKEIATYEEQFIAANKGQIKPAKEIVDQWFAGVNALRAQNTEINQKLGNLNSELQATISTEAAKKKAADEAKKAADDAYNKRIEQIKNERTEIQKLLKATREDTLKSNQDQALDQREFEASKVKNRFDQEKLQLQISTDRQNAELESARKAALDQVNETIISEREKNKAREVINAEFNQRTEAATKDLNTRLADIEQQRADQVAKVNEALITELNYGDSQFADTRNARDLESAQFRNELAQRELTENTDFNSLTLAQRKTYYQSLAQLQLQALDIEKQQRESANDAIFQQELQLAKDRKDSGEITAEQLLTIEKNLDETRKTENEKVEKDIAQKRKQINQQTEEEILQARLASYQQYLNFATQGVQALSAVSQAVETSQLNRVAETNNKELEANSSKNQEMLNQELSRINQENISETEKQAKREEALKKQNKKKENEDKATELKIEAQRNEIRKKAFQRTKALNITTALINGAQSVMQAIAQFGPPPSPLGIAGIVSAGILTAAQVAAIAAQQYQPEGGGGGGGALSLPDTSASIPEATAGAGAGGFTTFNPDLVNVPTMGTRGGSGVGGTGNGLRVYVLESDITNSQKRVKTTVEQATFG